MLSAFINFANFGYKLRKCGWKLVNLILCGRGGPNIRQREDYSHSGMWGPPYEKICTPWGSRIGGKREEARRSNCGARKERREAITINNRSGLHLGPFDNIWIEPLFAELLSQVNIVLFSTRDFQAGISSPHSVDFMCHFRRVQFLHCRFIPESFAKQFD